MSQPTNQPSLHKPVVPGPPQVGKCGLSPGVVSTIAAAVTFALLGDHLEEPSLRREDGPTLRLLRILLEDASVVAYLTGAEAMHAVAQLVTPAPLASGSAPVREARWRMSPCRECSAIHSYPAACSKR
jgi:hypothetical protein